jgi:CHASE2 domain-containing sensor protein
VRPRIPARYFGLIAGACVIVLVLVLDAGHVLQSLDLKSVDARFSIRGSERPNDVAVVGIDERTTNALRNETFPYRRRLDAQVITNLARAGAKVIAFDLVFIHPSDPADDNALILAVRAAGNVVLATTQVGPGGSSPIFGGGRYLAYSRATSGEAQFPIDADGAIRRMTGQLLGLTTFPVAVANRMLGRAVSFPGGPRGNVPIDFAGPTNAVPEISFADVLNGSFSPAAVRGKVVVVGPDETDLQDIHATATDQFMPGVVVEANAISTALRGFPLQNGPGWLNVLLIILFGMAAPVLGLRYAALAVAGMTAAAIFLLAVVVQLAFDGGTIIGFVYPAVAAVLGAAATFALQGRRVRSLEAALPSPAAAYFVSYRRGQSELAANMLKGALARKLGDQAVFMDTDGIDTGDRWPRRLQEALERCEALLVLIGPSWLDARTADGMRRLDDAGDWVRRELETALMSDQTVVVPVLHDGAHVPARSELPESLKALVDCQAVKLTGVDLDRWIDELDKSVYAARVRRAQREPVQQPATT